MSKVTKCDICGKVFDLGFAVDVSIQGGQDFTNISEDRFEIGRMDVCRNCYYGIKRMAKQKGRTAEI